MGAVELNNPRPPQGDPVTGESASLPALADVQREFPGYDCWRAISGLCYARPHHTPPGRPAPVSGGNPAALRDAITHHQAQQRAAHRDAIIKETLSLIFGPAPTPGAPGDTPPDTTAGPASAPAASPCHPVRSRGGTA